jgi:GT2 family glycosyltransferase
VVVPVCNTRDDLLRLCLDSVIGQSYPHWELAIADDASDLPSVSTTLARYAKDSRISVVYRAARGHIAAATNSALGLVKSQPNQFIAFLDHDDTLDPHALYHMAAAILACPEAQVLYSDEDHINDAGVPQSAHLKSAWNPDLFFSNNYVCHLAVYKKRLIDKVGGMRPGVDGSQDQDLLLRCLKHIPFPAQSILHIPRVLYHWRMTAGSVALDQSIKPYTTVAGVKALTDYFAERELGGPKVEQGPAPNTYRVVWPLLGRVGRAPLVSLIVPVGMRHDDINATVSSLLTKTDYEQVEIIVVENGRLRLRKELADKVTVVHCDGPYNYAAFCNAGANAARGAILGFIGSGIEIVSSDWLSEMVRHAWREEVGCVGARLIDKLRRVQHGGYVLGLGGLIGTQHKMAKRDSPGYYWWLQVAHNVSAVSGACMLVRSGLYDEVGGMDEERYPAIFYDVDLCLRVWREGYWNVWTPYAEAYYAEDVRRHWDLTREHATLRAEWGSVMADDPFYHPNLTEGFRLADPSKLVAPKLFRRSMA